MIVVTVNSGSTSVKLAAYELPDSGGGRRICHLRADSGTADRKALLAGFLAGLKQAPDAIAHRVVHGGRRFTAPARIDPDVFREIAALSELAPLHNPEALHWIEAAQSLCGPQVAQVAAFDTAFFAGLPDVAREYAVSRELSLDHGVCRYGFHGLAHEAMLRSWEALHPELPGGGRLITVQLGGGCSIAAVRRGCPLDTSMGFSPLEGLVMATRSGDIDPAVVPHLQHRLGKSAAEVIELLNRQSGLLAVSGLSGDLDKVLASDSPGARFAIDLYCYRARKYIGAYLAVLGGCDGIAFGGGVGEHVPEARARILDDMRWAGIELDPAANQAAHGQQASIGRSGSPIEVLVLPVDEEILLAGAAAGILGRPGTMFACMQPAEPVGPD